MTGRPAWHRVLAAAFLLLLSAATLTSAQNLFPTSGNAGIGTTNPMAPLTVMSTSGGEGMRLIGRANGDEANILLLKNNGSTFHGAIIGSNGSLSLQGGSAGPVLTVTGSRHVGIGTTNPLAPLTVVSTSAGEGMRLIGRSNLGNDEANILLLKNNGSTYHGAIIGSWGTLNLMGGSGGIAVTVTEGRNVGIGTTSPTAKLHVAGDVKVDGNIAAKYQDVAEWVPARPGLLDGTVMVVDRDKQNHVLPSSTPYDTGVAGVVSAQPGIVLGEPGSGKVKVSHNGRVKVKVDAGYGAVKVGDLLVTSSTPGYAMRSVPVDVSGATLHRPGTILGKALESLESGQGEILVLLTLQ